MATKSFILAVLIVASVVVCSRRDVAPISHSINSSSQSFAAVTFKKDGACNLPQLTNDTMFKGGATTGEEITVRLDTAAQTYQISIDASHSALRQATLRAGALIFNPGDCNYTMSGEKSAQIAVSTRGVLIGGIDDDDPDGPPAAIIAFMETSSQLRDLAGDWWVSGRESITGAAALSRSVSMYETTIQSDGHFSNCNAKADASDVGCIRNSGSFVVQGAVFRSTGNNASDTSLVLGKVDGKFVPVLLTRDEQGKGLHFLWPRSSQHTALSPRT